MGLLLDAMVDAQFEEGQYVFECGDKGDAFYVIAEGKGCITREEEPGAPPTILAQVGHCQTHVHAHVHMIVHG